ncbi:MAG TPA: hypothetical protein PKN04_01015 [bacterium]|jgi:hypothetical protein|nr:hypothetical protein [bacterium]
MPIEQIPWLPQNQHQLCRYFVPVRRKGKGEKMIVGIWGAELLKLVLGAALVGAASTAVLLKTVDVDSSAAENSSMTCNAAEKYSTLQLQTEWPPAQPKPDDQPQPMQKRASFTARPPKDLKSVPTEKKAIRTRALRSYHRKATVCCAHVLQPGEDLVSVCNDWRVSYRLVLGLSGFSSGRDLCVGDTLWLPESTH